MAETEYWFARYALVPNRARGIRPLNGKGTAVIAGFVGLMVAGGLLFLLLALLTPLFALGVALFVLCAICAGALLIWAGVAKSDPVRTVADYQKAGLLK